MYEILPKSIERVVALKAMNRLTDADFEVLEPVVARMIEDAAPARVFLDWSDLVGWDGKGEARSFLFWQRNWWHIERVAIVSSEKFLSDVTRLKQILTHSDVRHFSLADEDKAWAWLRSE